MNWWQKLLFYISLGFIAGYLTKDNLAKPDEVTNIKSNTKIKGNKGVVETETLIEGISTPEKEKKRRFKLFKRKKKNDRARNN